MELKEDIVIVGAGIAGLATALGLHRLGLKSLVLESSTCLRVTGAAFTTWTNAWQALDALGIGNSLRGQHLRLHGMVATSTTLGVQIGQTAYTAKGTTVGHEVRCLKRKVLLETLANELPSGTIRFSSKVASVEKVGSLMLLCLADGTILKTKVLIGCDGVNSVVARYLGLKKPSFDGRSAIRGYAVFKESHGFEPKIMQFIGEGKRYGIVPCDDTSLYWFFTSSSSYIDKEIEGNPAKMKQFVLSNLEKVPDKIRNVIEITKVDDIICSQLRLRSPWEILLGDISKDNVCVAGDAFHPMTPDLGQGACSALEDGIVLARCLAEAFTEKSTGQEYSKEEEYERIKISLKKYAKERRWRGFDLVTTAYLLGAIMQSNDKMTAFLRNKVVTPFLGDLLLKKASFNCGQLAPM
ncbi:hypothetical protein Nepgr_004784 [Nepenthes gracilis]|uniref:FAD-binding domain-containing protein n=1 Tax=Nepenthes gracilis TaxID=150966 RepID=A0AAD3S208_NEPGR|nr:hypothetical protein Nepgr_004784 [Nepenthes gracilis]